MAHFDGIHRRYIALEKEIKFFNKIPGVLLWGFFWLLKFSGKKKTPHRRGLEKHIAQAYAYWWVKYGAFVCSIYFNEGFNKNCKKLYII